MVRLSCPLLFQSTHPRGVRPEQTAREPHGQAVSIHAPAWGATTRSSRPCWICLAFQSTHPRGVRPVLFVRRIWRAVRFQSTHPRGVRLIRRYFPSSIREFQSTHPRGVRPHYHAILFNVHPVSIHAPAWGATLARKQKLPANLVSIHAPAWGATSRCHPGQGAAWAVSIHAPAWGATIVFNVQFISQIGFNPRTRVGCDTIHGAEFRIARLVSIHAPAWGATNRTL